MTLWLWLSQRRGDMQPRASALGYGSDHSKYSVYIHNPYMMPLEATVKATKTPTAHAPPSQSHWTSTSTFRSRCYSNYSPVVSS